MKLKALFVYFICFAATAAIDDYDAGLVCLNFNNFSCAIVEFQKAATQGDARAQNALGWMYDNGRGVKQDSTKAFEWYQKAAEQGNAIAQYNLGLQYSKGLGIKQDNARAVEWFHKAATQGIASAQNDLGFMYDNGRGVKQDSAKAFEWYQKAAAQGDAIAQYNLGQRYRTGLGIKQDYVKAVEWYQKAAAQGIASAQNALGGMYELGLGVKQDDSKAIDWYQKAAAQGDASAKKQLLHLSRIGTCTKSAKTELFGVLIKCANRDQLREAVKQAGLGVKRENKNYWTDVYLSDKALKGSSELEIIYTAKDIFAKAQYTFPSHLDADQIVHVRDFVANKYGNPTTSTGNTTLGDASFEWRLVDGIILTVSRGWPDTTTYLSFTHPKNHKEARDEYEQHSKEQAAKEYNKQSNAF
ncbi:MAG TPA: hypothetical protein DF774_17900 [Rheinheimera sp.]|uniref:tetratricopeptide repeat protein n=1 Tax=Rheinheimera sp. TaxID=1869214 RepID=UPI000EEFC78C|nr:tetratricopeptide repeat protein [Rheinheimera sp.]HCU67625.1 hypothetical protein [Rheinheimera sp.]